MTAIHFPQPVHVANTTFNSDNAKSLNFAAFKAFNAFNASFRRENRVLRVDDARAVISQSDPAEMGGTVGFKTHWVFKRKKDGVVWEGETMYVASIFLIPSIRGSDD